MKACNTLAKLILKFLIPSVVFVDLANAATCTPNESPSDSCDGLLLNNSDLQISIPNAVTVNSFITPEWAVDIDADTENITLINSGTILGVDRGISLRSTTTNISITNAVNGRIFTLSGPGIFNEGGISTLTNNGLIDSPYSGITNQGAISTLTNNNEIFGQFNAIGNEVGRITSMSNNDSLISGQFGISNTTGAYIGSVLNTNSIEVNTAVGLGMWVSSGIFNYQSEIGSITNGADSSILSTDNAGLSLVNSGITNTNDVEGPADVNSSIGDIVNRGSIKAIGGSIVAGISNGYLPKFSSGPPTIASGSNSIQSITNYGTLYGEGDGLIAAGVLNGGFAPLNDPDDRDESYNYIARIENFFRIEGKTSSPSGGFGAGIFNGAISFFGGGISNRDGYVIGELINNPGSTVTGSSMTEGTLGVGILNAGFIREIRNAGVIDSSTILGSVLGIYNIGVIGTLSNLTTGTIQNGIFNVDIGMGADLANISQLINAGVIQNTGSNFDPDSDPGPGTASSFAIHNLDGAIINNLTNTETGRIINGIGNSTNSTINYLTNFGEIQAGIGGYGIINAGLVGELNNSGTISAGSSGAAINNLNGTITTLNNFAGGTISAGSGGTAINNLLASTIDTLNNFALGTILVGDGGYGILNHAGGIITALNNSGTIYTGLNGLGIYSDGVITTLNNSGTIYTGDAGSGISVGSTSVTTTLNNTGTISAGNAGYGIFNDGLITTLKNSGTISAGDNGNGIYNGGLINTLTNTGSILGGIAVSDIFGASTGIGMLNNLQGGASNSALAYSGKLPNNYNIIINSATQFGQLVASEVAGTMAFGVMEGPSFPTGTYTSVLRGISASNINAGLSGIHNNYYFWSLVPNANNVWDMSVYFDISSNTTGLVSIDNLTGSGPAILGTQSLLLTSASGTYSGVISGSGGITMNGGKWILTGANTYSGGTTVASGTLSVAGPSPTGTGAVNIASGATLMGRGTITGNVNVSGNLKPGNSPGYLSTTSTVTMNTGSTYLQDIAGTVQASNTSPVGATGYYSFLNVINGQFVIQPGSTLAPQLSNLFTVDQPGFGSAIYMPGLGNRLRIMTAAGGISGKFSTVTKPAELAVGTQFLPFYNMAGSNSIDLAVIPTSYQTTIAAASGNTNAQSVGSALTQIAQASLAGTSTAAQDQLLYAISGQSSAQAISNLAQGMSGEVYAATVAVMAQTTQRTQQSVLNRLGDTAGLSMNSPVASASMTTSPGGAPGAAVSSNPQVNPNAEAKTFSNRNVWGDLVYQKGNRSNDSQSGGWSSNLYQLTFGSDLYSSNGTILGAGFALSSTTVNPVYGAATLQQGALFAYGKMPVKSFVLDAMASIGLSSSDIKRGDATGLSSGFKNTVSGNDALLSLGLSRPMDLESVRISPFVRITWQMVTQTSVNEGGAPSALSVNGYSGNGVRGVIGISAGSKTNNPMTAKNTYRAYVALGADSSGLLNPTLNASLAGMGTNIMTPNAGATFIQAGLYGTAKMSENTFAYAGISGEARNGQTLGTLNVGLKLQF